MNILSELQNRFHAALTGLVDDPAELAEMVRPSQDAKFGDYQANCAMPLAKRLDRPSREVAAEIAAKLRIDDLCEPAEVAGPGFINLKLRQDWLTGQLSPAVNDQRLGVEPVAEPRTFVVDYSGPNVAKPMHVGHIRSTVIGDAVVRTLRFLGHRVISDNHVGDWGTQFGMIIYGYKHFADQAAYERSPVEELSRLYRLVNRLIDYHSSLEELPKQRAEAERLAAALAVAPEPAKNPKAETAAAKARKKLESDLREAEGNAAALDAKIGSIEADPLLASMAKQHPRIAQTVLAETASLHVGSPGNLRLWREFLPPCLVEIERVYQRLGVTFDQTLGESFYHDRLEPVVGDLLARGVAKESEGATCVFLPGETTPLIIRKQDGAFLYATTDLATIQYRLEHWTPDAILYVVDHRQGLHFKQLFATARLWGHDNVELTHVSFGTVLGEDKRPFKTRSGDTVGLWGLLDEAVRRAHLVVSQNDDAKKDGPELSAEERQRIAEVVGIAALKYADLSQNRTSDYVFSYDKMLLLNGNTATYMQYAYARVRGIFTKGQIDPAAVRASGLTPPVEHPAERALGLELLRFGDALNAAMAGYFPHVLTTYLFELANRYSTFYEQCPVLKAETDELRIRRALLCDLTARTLKQGLELLGISVVEKM